MISLGHEVREPERWAMPLLIAQSESYRARSGDMCLRLRLHHPYLPNDVVYMVPYEGLDRNGGSRGPRVIELLRAVDAPQDMLASLLDAGEMDEHLLVHYVEGRQLLAELGLDAYNGQTHVRVHRLLPAMPYVGRESTATAAATAALIRAPQAQLKGR